MHCELVQRVFGSLTRFTFSGSRICSPSRLHRCLQQCLLHDGVRPARERCAAFVTWSPRRQRCVTPLPAQPAFGRHTTGLPNTALLSAVIVMFRAAGGAPNLKQPKVKVRLPAGPSPTAPGSGSPSY